MLSSLAVMVSISAEWVAILVVAAPLVVYMWSRRASQSSIVTESRVLAEKSVKNIEELWDKRDDLRDRIEAVKVDQAYHRGEHAAERRLQPRPPA